LARTEQELKMKHRSVVFSILGALALGLMATSASALPDVSLTLGATYPLHLFFADNGNTPWRFSSATGNVFEGKGFSELHLFTELSALGTYSLDLLNAKASANGANCNSTGDAAGVILESGEVHVVLTRGGVLANLFLISSYEIECGALSDLIRGSYLVRLNAGKESETLTSETEDLTGSNGKQELSEYFNSAGTLIKAKLEIEAGSGFVASDEDVEEEYVLSALGSKMYVITGR
jgi:hypothetical protein